MNRKDTAYPLPLPTRYRLTLPTRPCLPTRPLPCHASLKVRADFSSKTPGAATPGPPQPGQNLTPPTSTRTTFHKFAALHPYDDQWCIKAKLDKKYPVRCVWGGGEGGLSWGGHGT